MHTISIKYQLKVQQTYYLENAVESTAFSRIIAFNTNIMKTN
jgi:hypothetical protein